MLGQYRRAESSRSGLQQLRCSYRRDAATIEWVNIAVEAIMKNVRQLLKTANRNKFG